MLMFSNNKKENTCTYKAEAQGGGNCGTTPPPEIGKIVVENWCYLPGVYTLGGAEIPEIVKNCEKLKFHNLKIFFKISKISSFFVQSRKALHAGI